MEIYQFLTTFELERLYRRIYKILKDHGDDPWGMDFSTMVANGYAVEVAALRAIKCELDQRETT